MILTRKNRIRRKTFLNVTLSTTRPTWLLVGAKTGLLGEKPATNLLTSSCVRVGIIFLNCLCVVVELTI
jgi:hypothetical protein